MADLGFLPGVKRLLSATPRDGQKLLFSATLDGGIKVIVDRFLNNPVTHEADSAQSPVATMTHHVLEVDKDSKLSVLRDLAAAPGRTVVFTRTKYGAKKLAKQLTANGVPSVDLHGNLSQNARQRNLAAFSEGTAQTLVATDIAARGIHVDDIALVVHADPPAEHKAYLHRSGRTARAGAEGTVVTIAMPEQRGEVKTLMRAAKIRPVTEAKAVVGAAVLQEVAPGERVFRESDELAVATAPPQQGGSGGGRGGRSGGRGGSGGGRGAGRSGGRGGSGGRSGGRGASAGGSGRGGDGGPVRFTSESSPRGDSAGRSGGAPRGERGAGRPPRNRGEASARPARGEGGSGRRPERSRPEGGSGRPARGEGGSRPARAAGGSGGRAPRARRARG